MVGQVPSEALLGEAVLPSARTAGGVPHRRQQPRPAAGSHLGDLCAPPGGWGQTRTCRMRMGLRPHASQKGFSWLTAARTEAMTLF